MKKKNYETLGVMLDMSRNAVMSVESLKTYFGYLKKMGYNCVMLYTEDTYEVDGEPYLGYMRGRYSKAELIELDEYAAGLGIELIPCIQTLAHLQGFVPWKQVPIDNEDAMLVDDPRTYEFIENVIKSCRECFKSSRLHIGMDEAWTLGRGKFMDLHGYEHPTSIIKRHLANVCEIVRKYDFEPMMWSDMFFRSINPGNAYYTPKREMPKEVIEAVPEDVIPVYWDYYRDNEEAYDNMLYNHEQLSNKTWFAGGAWTWRGFLPMNGFSILSMHYAIDACRKHKVKNIFVTMWGDDGHECSRYAIMPTLYNLAEYVRGNDDEEKIRRGFRRIFGADYDAFMSLDKLNGIVSKASRNDATAKLVLFNDYFNGFNDIRLLPNQKEYIESVADEWHGYARKYRRWAYMFDSAAKLADALAVKYDLGIRTRAAYLAGDKDELRELAKKDYVKVYKLIEKFALAFEKQWNIENKPTGFDVQDIRLGGLLRRTDSCRRRLLDYTSGKIDEIPELAFELLEGVVPSGSNNCYGKMCTVNRLTHKIL